MKSALFRTTSIAATFALTALAVTACGAPAQSGGADTSAGVIQANTTDAAVGSLDTATWLIAKEPATSDLDNSASSSNTDIVMSNVCDKIIQLGTDLTVQPSIATDWEWTSDSELVFTLRDDVVFHDGTPMTADDVVWSMQRHMAEDAKQKNQFATVAGVRKTGDYEVTFDMKQRDAIITNSLANGAGVIWNRKVIEAQGDSFGTPAGIDACSGPFTLESWESGTEIVLKKAENYWNPDRAAKTDEFIIRWGSDDSIANQLATGEADGAYLENLSIAANLIDNDDINVVQGEDTRVWNLMVTERGGLTDPRLRQALSLVLDRQGIDKAAFSGLGPAWSQPVGSAVWSFERDKFETANAELEFAPVEVTDENIARARELVAEVGDTEEIVVATDGEAIRSTLAEAVVSAGESIGLDVRILRIPTAQYGDYYGDESVRNQADLFSDDFFVSTYDPVGFYKNGNSESSVEWLLKDPEFDDLIARTRASMDDSERAELEIELAQRWNETLPWISANATPSTVAFSKDVTGIPASGIFRYYPWAADLGASEE